MCGFKKKYCSPAATALANEVLPVPLGPYNKTPRGGGIPTVLNTCVCVYLCVCVI